MHFAAPPMGQAKAKLSAQRSRLSFGDHKISQIRFHDGLRSVSGTISVECYNDSLAFEMSEIAGTVYKKGEAFVSGSAEPVAVPAGGSTVVVSGLASLCEGITLWDVLACIAFKAEDYTIDISMRIVNAKGVERIFERSDMSVADVLQRRRGRK